MKTVYFNSFSGVSGDMILGAFVDLGVPVAWLSKIFLNIYGLKKADFQIIEKKSLINGISAVDICVKDYNQTCNRDYSSIKFMIEKSRLSAFVKDKSIAIFNKIAEAEAKIHNLDIEKVHFHEIGAIDSIIDIIGAVLCIEYLDIKKIYSSKIPVGSGSVKTAHGIIPAPAPATLEILKNIPAYGLEGINTEITTPTGAAILSVLSENFGKFPEMTIEKTGYGAGKKDLGQRANILAVTLGASYNQPVNIKQERITVIEANIDDANPEFLGFVMEKLLTAGALDVSFIPIFTKKNRPATIIKILSSNEKTQSLINIIFTEQLSSGVRYYKVKRKVSERKEIFVKTEYGKIKAKKIINPDGSFYITPEYDECRKKALEFGVSMRLIYQKIAREAQN
ncbi:MAG: nickel pincer cofactor biosynthesis protein LarC [Deltaproteobacteria bacterium]|nr:nickel pincer cofactor biosynthesis protein LarC [Deltaproteobacteria bacterium]